MKIENYKSPESSFFTVDKDLSIIIDYMLKDETLKKLLWYTTKDALRKPKLTEEESASLLGDYIKITPKMKVDEEVLNYIVISFDAYTTNKTNPQFRDNAIIFDIVCHYDQWQLENFSLRPFRIAAQIDTILKKVKLTNMGQLEFAAGNQVVMNGEFAGFTLMYNVVHGGEDTKYVPGYDPKDESGFNEEAQEAMVKAFNEIFNSKD